VGVVGRKLRLVVVEEHMSRSVVEVAGRTSRLVEAAGRKLRSVEVVEEHM
jgi:hypothetical protein